MQSRLAELAARGLRRSLRPPRGIDLSSNDYLGLARDPVVRDALLGALRGGLPHGGTGSRLLTGEHRAWSDLEEDVASWQGCGASLYFSTGFAANLGLLSSLPVAGDVVLSDALNHASLIDGLRLSPATRVIVPHLDLDAYATALREHRDRGRWVVVESVYSMDGDLAPLAQLAQLCNDEGAGLIVDEAHATGLYGATGAGRIEQEGVREAVFASVHTCGKALGLAGAFVCGSRMLRELLLNRARSFVFSTAAPPFMAAGLRAAIQQVSRQPELRERPQRLAERLRTELRGEVDLGASASAIVPLIVGTPQRALALAALLADRGWDARAIRPPTVPAGRSRVRVVLNAQLSEAQVDALAEHVRQALVELA